MDDAIFSSHGESLEEVVLLMLGMRHLTLATAESCTGGLLAQRLTAVPNSSSATLSAAPSSTPPRSRRSSPEFPKKPSTRKARSAKRWRERSPKASAAAPEPRSASPSPASPAPAAAAPAPTPKNPSAGSTSALPTASKTQVKELNLTGDRERIRFWATQHALELIRRHLL